MPQFISAAETWLRNFTDWAGPQRAAMADIVSRFFTDPMPGRPTLIGIGGPPGTGKSLLARLLAATAPDSWQPCTVLSLDDYYLPKSGRARRAAEIHHLFAQRGAPGTHDIDLLCAHLDALQSEGTGNVLLPRFDKAADDRCAELIPWVGPEPRVLFLEGWCVGCPPPPESWLDNESSTWESASDPHLQWRRSVRSFMRDYDRRINGRLDRRWVLLPPDWTSVIDWRWRQEQELGRSRLLADRESVARFLAPFERWCRFITATAPTWADLVVRLGPDHRPSVPVSGVGTLDREI